MSDNNSSSLGDPFRDAICRTFHTVGLRPTAIQMRPFKGRMQQMRFHAESDSKGQQLMSFIIIQNSTTISCRHNRAL